MLHDVWKFSKISLFPQINVEDDLMLESVISSLKIMCVALTDVSILLIQLIQDWLNVSLMIFDKFHCFFETNAFDWLNIVTSIQDACF